MSPSPSQVRSFLIIAYFGSNEGVRFFIFNFVSCKAAIGIWHNMAAISGAFPNMKLQFNGRCSGT